MAEVAQGQDGDTGVEGLGALETARGAHQETANLAAVDVGHEAALDLVHVLLHVGEGGALGTIDLDEKAATILLGGVLPGQFPQEPDRPD